MKNALIDLQQIPFDKIIIIHGQQGSGKITLAKNIGKNYRSTVSTTFNELMKRDQSLFMQRLNTQFALPAAVIVDETPAEDIDQLHSLIDPAVKWIVVCQKKPALQHPESFTLIDCNP